MSRFEYVDEPAQGRYEFVDEPAAVSTGKAINSIPRQLGLTGRYGLEGIAQAAQIFTEPVAGVMRAAGIPTKSLGEIATQAADAIGLPRPQGANERVIGDAARLLAGGGGTIKAGQMLAKLPGMLGLTGGAIAQAPTQQLAAATGAGLASGASREAGGDGLTQTAAGVLGGIAGGITPSGLSAIRNTAQRVTAPVLPAPLSQRLGVSLDDSAVDSRISASLSRIDVDYNAIPEKVKQALRTELRSSLQAGKELDPNAVRRLADFRAVGATPTRGSVSLDPVQITKEMNLAKMAANSSDGELQGLPRIQNQNNTTLIGRLNDLGGAKEIDPIAAGRALNSSVLAQQEALRSAERAAWQEARGLPGYTQSVSPAPLNAVNSALGEEGMMGFMNPTISRYMEAFQTGQQPFTPQAYRNLQSMLSGEMAKGGNEAAAAGIARRALEASELIPVKNAQGRDFGGAGITGDMAAKLRALDEAPGDAIAAVDRARAATRAAYAYEDSSPMVRSVLSDGASADPQRIANRFVIGGTPDEAAVVAGQVGPEGRALIRDALATHIKRKALSGASDEIGKVSQSRLNSAIKEIGDEKLGLFFTPDEIGQLKTVGRVASYTQVQPTGSAVNNSNSGALLLGRGYDFLKKGLAMVPGVGPIAAGTLDVTIGQPARNASVWMAQRQSQNVVPGLLMQPARTPMGPGLLGPGLTYGGLLAAPVSE